MNIIYSYLDGMSASTYIVIKFVLKLVYTRIMAHIFYNPMHVATTDSTERSNGLHVPLLVLAVEQAHSLVKGCESTI